MQPFRSVRHGGKVLRRFLPQPGEIRRSQTLRRDKAASGLIRTAKDLPHLPGDTPGKALPRAKKRAELGRAARAVVDRTFAPDGSIIKYIAELRRRADVFHGQKIVRRIEHRRALAKKGTRCPCARRGKRRSAGEFALQCFGKFRRVEHRRRLFERGEIAALAAEGECVDNARCSEQPHAAAGEALGRGKTPRQRQLDHERHAAAHRSFRAGEFIVRGRLAALHKIAGHDRGDGRFRAEDLAYFPYLVPVSAVKRIVFRNDPDRFHINPSFFTLAF